MTALVAGTWLAVRDGDDRARGLFQRHYSAEGSTGVKNGSRQFVAPGRKFVLLNTEGTALFVWLLNTVPRWDRQEGAICTAFRNESSQLSSDLIREADDLAWARWPDTSRHFTYVNPAKVRSANPGYCFIRAGYRRCGESKSGLVILERFKE